jgi:4,5-DOPA dioxygenase extradiol
MTVITDNPSRASFVELGKRLPRPSAVLCISAHWETQGRSHLTAGDHPRTIHDFGGFPQALFDMQYPAPGSDGLVERVAALLGEDRISRDASWGFDHGSWGVLQPMFPECDVPTVQLSLDRSLGADAHLDLGHQLAPLRDDGVLIVASGNVVHNLALWRQSAGTVPEWAKEFQTRINAAIVAGDDSALTRFAADDDAAAKAINSAEHYLPLLYAVGARLPGDDVAFFNDTIDGALSMTSVLVGDAALVSGIT